MIILGEKDCVFLFNHVDRVTCIIGPRPKSFIMRTTLMTSLEGKVLLKKAGKTSDISFVINQRKYSIYSARHGPITQPTTHMRTLGRRGIRGLRGEGRLYSWVSNFFPFA